MPSLDCDALLFDLDGVLIDSEEIYERHWKRWADGQNVSIEHVLAIHHGRPAVQIISTVAPHLDAKDEAKRFNAALEIDTNIDGLVAYKGAAALLQSLPPERWAIATSAPRTVALSRLEYLKLPVPRVLVTLDGVKNGKPAPDPYLRAAEGLKRAPSRCLVIEDAPAGIEAARKAGARVLAISSTNTPEALQAADAIVPRLGDLEIRMAGQSMHVSWSENAW